MNFSIRSIAQKIYTKILVPIKLNSTYPKCTFNHVTLRESNSRHMLILIDPYNKCNLRCIMCSYPLEADDPPTSIKYEDFSQIAQQFFPVSRQVNLSCAYEPLMFREFFDYLNTTLPYDLHRLTIVTNAILLTRTKARQIVESGLPQINISVDGATKQTYEKVRVLGNFDTLLKNLEHLVNIKDEMAHSNPRIQFQFAMLPENFQEAPELVKKLSKFKPYKFVFIHQDYTLPAPERRAEVEIILREALMECVKYGFIFEEVPNFCLSFEEILKAYGGDAADAPKLEYGCLDPWNFMQITPNGNVFMCPTIRKPAGNIFQTNIMEIWNGKDYRQLREQWNRKAPPSICQTCSYSNIGLVQLRRAQDQMEKSITNLITYSHNAIPS